MKRTVAALVAALGWSLSSAQAQTYPAVMSVIATEVEVRSGPTKEYHPTIKLRRGDRVLVRRQSKAQPTWLCVAPPQGSFSWINAKSVKQMDAKTGYVIGDANQEVEIMPGSSVVGAAPNTVSFKVKPGYQFAILGQPMTSEGNTWLPITPHPEEDRFIPADAVQGGGGAAIPLVTTGGGAGANALITQADQAYLGGNLARAKQMYQEAAERTTDNQQKSYCYNRLASLAQGSWTTNPPGHPGQTSGPPTQLASLTNQGQNPVGPSGNQYATSWSKWGLLRNTAYEKDGQPMFVLENDRGTPLLYVTTTPGFSLKGYVGKMVAIYGPLSYHNQIRAYYMTASHVAENK